MNGALHIVAGVALALVLPALAGCERTAFQSAPAPPAQCDPALVGHWLSLGDRRGDEGELQAIVDAGCNLVAIERKADGERRSAPARLHNARVGGSAYLWLDAGWARRSFDIDATPIDRDGDVFLFAYRLRRGQLQLDAPPHRALARHVLDGSIEGDLLQQDGSLAVRIRGDQAAIGELLRRYRPYRFDDPIRFRRAEGGAPE